MIRGVKCKLSFSFLFFSFFVYSQDNDSTWEVEAISNVSEVKESEEETEKSSSIFKFEPDYLDTVEEDKVTQKRNREILDTLSISERKRKRLLKKVFTKNFYEDLSRVADIKFEDQE